MTAAEQWTAELRAWEIPTEILSAAPRDPYAFCPSQIRRPAVDPRGTPTGRVVAERLAAGERLLDVGVGAGRIAGAFAGDHDVLGVEPREGLAATAREVGITVIPGRWPDVADSAGRAPVVLSSHVLYDVQDPGPFLAALHRAAARRVVIEVTAVHPWVRVGPLYRLVHGIDRPTGPSAELLADVVADVVGTRPRTEAWQRPGGIADDVEEVLDHTRRMVCIDASHPQAAALDEAVRADLADLPGGGVQMPPVDQVTLWWDVDA
ncbi:class I SAM-dependent methyltransferase [Euzebya sp.]|uniref:class I SAM-dependent methyltransferase n=1 Tax=Euzebya sp. TaxID=1971409 RepID=UPI003510F1CD